MTPSLSPDAKGAGQSFLGGRVVLYPGNCIDVLATLPENSVDAVITDPPYHLTSIVKRFGADGAAAATGGVYNRSAAGFMGKQWDGGDIAFQPSTWAAVLRVLKPGGHVIAFSGTRTYHRMACAIEDAGFEIRDQLGWVYGSGFPKSHDVSKAIDKAAGAVRSLGGVKGRSKVGGGVIATTGMTGGEYYETDPATPDAAKWQGWGTALKPAWEPICLARKPLDGTVAENVLKWGTGAINVDGCRVALSEGDDPRLGGVGSWTTTQAQSGDTVSLPRGTVQSSPLGRWPTNIVHDGSDEVLAAFPDSKAGNETAARGTGGIWSDVSNTSCGPQYGDSGSAARFFYSAKADKMDRIGSKHPTVKPVDLMQWLCRLVTPPGGVVLDPFAGSGSTGEAALREGFRAVLVEREAEYQADIVRRMELAQNPTKRTAVAKSKNNLQGAEGTPLFGGDNQESVGGGCSSTAPSLGTNNRPGRSQTMKSDAA